MFRPTIVVSVNAAWNLINFRYSLLRGLVEQGYRVVALAPPDGCESQLAAIGVEFEPIALDRHGVSPLGDMRLLAAYAVTLRRLRPAAYLSFTIKPNIYGGMACRLLGIPRIANIAGLGTTFMRRGLLNAVVRRLYATGLRGAQRVFFQNRDDRDRFLQEGLVDADCVALLPGSGVDLTRFTPSIRSADETTTFLVVTRLLKAKGVVEFVEAAAGLQATRPGGAKFQILGIRDTSSDGIDAAVLEAWSGSDHVELLDAVSDVRPILAGADCVVLPSYYPEGTPRSLLEAAASGKAIITTDMPGCRDVVDDGINGFLCRSRDVASLQSAMERYCNLPPFARAAMTVASRAKAEKDFDEKIVVRAYLDCLSLRIRPRQQCKSSTGN